MRRYQIAVLGSHRRDLPREIFDLAESTGKEIAKRGHILLTGASTGVSEYASKGAKSVNGLTIGISPYEKRQEIDSISYENSDVIIFSGIGYKGRNILTVRSADGIIVINGGFGTLNEITIAEDGNKPIVAIKNTKGCADKLEDLFKDLNPNYKKIRFVDDAVSSVDLILEMIENE